METTTWAELLHPGDADDFFDLPVFPPFDASLTSYSADNAWWMAELSRLVYRHDVPEKAPLTPSRAFFLAKAGLRELNFFANDKIGAQAILVASEQPGFAALVFRGTEQGIADFAANLADLHVRSDAEIVDVHTGFKGQLDSIWEAIELELAKLACPIFYTGHSLGAALATLAAARRSPQAVYAFGSPLVGNDAFARMTARLPIHRVVDGSDIVTVVPPTKFGFVHTGTAHRIGTVEAKPRLTTAILRVLRTLVNIRRHPPKYLADHAPKNYVQRLKEKP
jgi:triacylglycerol lipase